MAAFNFSKWLEESRKGKQQPQETHINAFHSDPKEPLVIVKNTHQLSSSFPHHPSALIHFIPRRFRDLWNYTTVMSVTAASMFIPYTILIALLIYKQHYNVEHYTYWIFTFSDLHLLLVLIGLQLEGYFEAFIVLFVFPILLGNVTLVPIVIAIVIGLNPEVFLNDTDVRGGSLSIGLVRNADWVLHTTIVQVFILLVVGYKEYASGILVKFLNSIHWKWAVLYIAYFIYSPLALVGIYALCEDPTKRYPTSLTRIEQFLIIFLCNNVSMILWLCALTHRVSSVRRVPNFGLLSTTKL